MHIVDKLKRKNIKVIEIQKWGTYLRKEWENNFANHLSEEEKKSIYLFDHDGYCGYLWHLFAYNKMNYLEGENAEITFNNESKNQLYLFYQHSDYALILENADMLNSKDLTDEIDTDIYIVDKHFNWTFVITHENDNSDVNLGPYFSRKEGNVR